eukprot:Rmarinus@m.13233
MMYRSIIVSVSTRCYWGSFRFPKIRKVCAQQCFTLTTRPERKSCGPVKPMQQSLLQDLSAQQRAIFKGLDRSTTGIVSVRAGPGTGKTEIVARRAALFVANGVPPSDILALTHTREAAKELSERINFFMEPHDISDEVWCGTIHAFAVRTLKEEGKLSPLVPEVERKRVIAEVLSETVGVDPNAMLGFALSCISMTKSYEDPEVGLSEAIKRLQYQLEKMEELHAFRGALSRARTMDAKSFARTLYDGYMAALAHAGWMDYDDYILTAVRLLDSNPELRDRIRRRFPHVLLDEAQDVTGAQAAFVLRLIGDSFFMTGDPDQTIYGFRGATGHMYDHMNTLGAQEYILNESYRMSPPIVEAVRSVLRGQEWNLPSHTPEEIEAYAEHKPILYSQPASQRAEVKYAFDCVDYFRYELKPDVEESEIAFIIRTWDPYFRLLASSLRDYGFKVSPRVMLEGCFPVETFAGMLYPGGAKDPAENEKLLSENIADLMRAKRRCGVKLFSAKSIRNTVLAARNAIMSKGGLSRGEVVQAARDTGYWEMVKSSYTYPHQKLVSAFAEAGGKVEVCEEDIKMGPKGGINILTAHSAKGREFDAVVILGMDKSFPYYRALPEEEEKLLYVAMTRARKYLALSFPHRPPDSNEVWAGSGKYGKHFFESVAASQPLKYAGHAVLLRRQADSKKEKKIKKKERKKRGALNEAEK